MSENPLVTPDQRAERRALYLKMWHDDWKPLVDDIEADTGMSRDAAMWWLATTNMCALRDSNYHLSENIRNLRKHPEFQPDCPHCIEEQSRKKEDTRRQTAYEEDRRVSREYMEKAMRYMEQDRGSDDWKPL